MYLNLKYIHVKMLTTTNLVNRQRYINSGRGQLATTLLLRPFSTLNICFDIQLSKDSRMLIEVHD